MRATNPSGRLMRLSMLCAVVYTLLALTLASATQAHSELEKATPADGATLEELPDDGTLTFSEQVSAQDVTVKAGSKALPVSQDDAHPKVVTFDLGSVTADQDVHLTWRIVDSHDGHESSGTIDLTVSGTDRQEAAPATKQTAAPEEPRAIRWLTVSSRVVGYLAMAVFVGGLLFVSLLVARRRRERRTRRLLSVAVVAGILAAVGSEAVVVWRSSGGMTLREALDEDFGRVATATALLWVLAAVVVAAVFQRGEDVVRRAPLARRRARRRRRPRPYDRHERPRHPEGQSRPG